jgi:hypothetical protein
MSHYPITITQARYGGTYEGGEWVAFHLLPEDIPEKAFGDDVTCVSWWSDHGDGVGTGSTPQEAHERLLAINEPLQMIRGRDNRKQRLARVPWKRRDGRTI